MFGNVRETPQSVAETREVKAETMSQMLQMCESGHAVGSRDSTIDRTLTFIQHRGEYRATMVVLEAAPQECSAVGRTLLPGTFLWGRGRGVSVRDTAWRNWTYL